MLTLPGPSLAKACQVSRLWYATARRYIVQEAAGKWQQITLDSSFEEATTQLEQALEALRCPPQVTPGPECVIIYSLQIFQAFIVMVACRHTDYILAPTVLSILKSTAPSAAVLCASSALTISGVVLGIPGTNDLCTVKSQRSMNPVTAMQITIIPRHPSLTLRVLTWDLDLEEDLKEDNKNAKNRILELLDLPPEHTLKAAHVLDATGSSGMLKILHNAFGASVALCGGIVNDFPMTTEGNNAIPDCGALFIAGDSRVACNSEFSLPGCTDTCGASTWFTVTQAKRLQPRNHMAAHS